MFIKKEAIPILLHKISVCVRVCALVGFNDQSLPYSINFYAFFFSALDDDPNIKRIEMSCGHVVSPESLTAFCRSLLDEVGHIKSVIPMYKNRFIVMHTHLHTGGHIGY